MSEQLEKRIVACAEAVQNGRGLQRALGVSDGYIMKVQDKAHELYRAGRNDDAELLCRGLIALAPERFYPHLLLSDILRRKGQLDGGLERIKTAAGLAPDNDLVKLKHAQLLMASGDYREARRVLNQVAPGNEFSAQARTLASRCEPAGAVP